MKFVMLRATTKQTVVEYQGQVAKNDDYYEDSSTSTDYYVSLCDELLKYFDRVEIWYQGDNEHKPCTAFVHNSGLIERYWPEGFEGVTEKDAPDVLFVRGDKDAYHSVIRKFRDAFKVYYSAGHYYLPPSGFQWHLVFVDDPRHVKEAEEDAYCPVRLFKKSCVDKYFPGRRGEGAVDIYFTCNAPQAGIKGLRFFLRLLSRELRGISAFCVGLRDAGMEKEFAGLPVYFTGFLPRTWVGQLMARSKLGLVLSNERDGSPRVISEYLCADLPIVVREQTTCSPFYVNDRTGVTPCDADMAGAIKYVLGNRDKFDPRNYFMEHLTMEKSAEWIFENIRQCQGPVPDAQG